MPLVRLDVLKGRTPDQIEQLLDAAHRAVRSAFEVPEGDRYQILTEHDADRFVIKDTGLGFVRTANVVVVSIVSRPRSRDAKAFFYAELCRELGQSCDIRAEDVIVSITINSDEDWSFGGGRAQFLTGEL